MFEPPEIFSTKAYFPEPQGDKETEKEETSEKNSWKMKFCLHDYIGCTKETVNAFQFYMVYSKFIWTLVGWKESYYIKQEILWSWIAADL